MVSKISVEDSVLDPVQWDVSTAKPTWKLENGIVIYVSDMDDAHLRNVARMLFENNLALDPGIHAELARRGITDFTRRCGVCGAKSEKPGSTTRSEPFAACCAVMETRAMPPHSSVR